MYFGMKNKQIVNRRELLEFPCLMALGENICWMQTQTKCGSVRNIYTFWARVFANIPTTIFSCACALFSLNAYKWGL